MILLLTAQEVIYWPVGSCQNSFVTRRSKSQAGSSRSPRRKQLLKSANKCSSIDSNRNATTAGPVSRDIFHDAAALEELLRQEHGWREWPLLVTDGDAAALMQAVSDYKVKWNKHYL